MADVARLADVSIATVSRALRGRPGVSAPTRDRILAAADQLAYVISPAASGLSQRSTRRIAVVVPRLDAWFQASMVAAIEETVRDVDVDLIVYQVDGETQRRRFFQHLPSRRKVDAVVLVALPLRAEEEERLDLLGVDVIVAGGRLRDYPHVEVDDRALALAATGHLLDLGHVRVGLIRTLDTEGAVWSSDVRRLQGYADAHDAAGVPLDEDLVVSEPYGVTSGAAGLARLLALPRPPTAVFCYSDEIAVAAWSELGRRGLRVPGQMSVVGVDGHPLSGLFGITTIDQGVPDQGRIAAQMALRLMDGEVLTESVVRVPWTLVDRGSTGPPA
ncbi:LacI family DNA-binding transcriptional regulator [Nocardioides sp.]|uniref:LacI family DNA-binding transcriptional regulator n=1 Tax=Nocardioides sp. TaxID=35761 RepID=UPI0027225B6A|nr:LacI family DNA-binding transcriptional regulator [Nocardioides sp.]MDO9456950.1 LacI family DNA-binding transcriptional regulator [Nocardioides sp.]